MSLHVADTQVSAKTRPWAGIASNTPIHNRIFSLGNLSDREADFLSQNLQRPILHEAASELTVAAPLFVLSGWVCRACTLPDGRRQILQLFIAGDLLSDHSRRKTGTSYACLTSVKTIDADALSIGVSRAPEQFPVLATAFSNLDGDTEERLIGQIVRTGRLRAHERLAHLILELYRRHQRCGQVAGNSFPMPLTQEVLADILGLSQVHINRMLQQLRHEGVVRTAAGKMEILDFARLATFACVAENEI